MSATETLAQYSVPEHHRNMFTNNVRAAMNRKGGDIVSRVSRGTYLGAKVQLVDFIGPVEFIERNTVYGDTKITEVEHTSRWISALEYDCAILVDRLDTLKMIYDPTSPYVERMREAAVRKYDEIVMNKFFAVAKTGKDGTTDMAFPNTNIIAHGGTGMGIAKLRALRKLMKKRHIDLRGVWPMIAVTADQIDDLLGETTTTSHDFNVVRPLVDGEVSRFMGFEFVPYEDYLGFGIPTFVDAGPANVRQCPVWVPDGMHFGSWEDLTVIISNRPDKNNIKQIHATFTAGSTRLAEEKVYQLQCKYT